MSTNQFINGALSANTLTITGDTKLASSGGVVYSGETPLTSIFSTPSSGVWIAGSGSNSIKANNDSGLVANGDYSVTEGYQTTASGNSSHAEGNSTTTVGDNSHSEGIGTTAIGYHSHAEGNYTIASGSSSHAEGVETTTIGNSSHTEGEFTTAIGDNSHAEGQSTTAVGDFGSHAEGFNTTAYDIGTHAEGDSTKAFGEASHAEGSQTTTIGNFSHSEGYNTKSGLRGFVITSISNGLITISDNIDYSSEFASAKVYVDDDSGSVRAYTVASINYSAPDFTIQLNDTTVNSGLYVSDSVQLNSTLYTRINASYTHSEGRDTQALGDKSHAEGSLSTALGYYSHAEGYSSVSEGEGSHAEGLGTLASGNASHAEGDITIASGSKSHSEGAGTTASGDYSHAQNSATIASGEASHAEGTSTTAIGEASHAEGKSTRAIGDYSHAGGNATTAGWKGFTVSSVVAGLITISDDVDYSSEFASGEVLLDSKFYSYNTINFSSPNFTIQLNDTSVNSGNYVADRTNLNSSLATQTLGNSSHSQGESTKALGNYSHAEGYDANATGEGSHTEGIGTIASNTASHAEGYQTTASGNYSHAEGHYTIASGDSSHAEGSGTTANGISSHSEGYQTQAGDYSHAEGVQTTASGIYGSHAEGFSTKATGGVSHAEGQITTASGDISHSEGYLTIASGFASHAQGESTLAFGQSSHAEGTLTTASGGSSHAEGRQTTAFGTYSHAGGISSIASGVTSFVHGSGSTASGTGTIVLGNNITGATDNTTYVNALNIKSIGNGASVFNLGWDSSGNIVSGSTFNSGLIYITNKTTGVATYYTTLELARDGAVSGDTIYVNTGTYVVTTTAANGLSKSGVNWFFQPGTVVSKATSGHMFSDNGFALNANVYGMGTFTKATTTGNIFYNTLANAIFEANSVTSSTDDCFVTTTASNLYFNVNFATSSGGRVLHIAGYSSSRIKIDMISWRSTAANCIGGITWWYNTDVQITGELLESTTAQAIGNYNNGVVLDLNITKILGVTYALSSGDGNHGYPNIINCSYCTGISDVGKNYILNGQFGALNYIGSSGGSFVNGGRFSTITLAGPGHVITTLGTNYTLPSTGTITQSSGVLDVTIDTFHYGIGFNITGGVCNIVNQTIQNQLSGSLDRIVNGGTLNLYTNFIHGGNPDNGIWYAIKLQSGTLRLLASVRNNFNTAASNIGAHGIVWVGGKLIIDRSTIYITDTVALPIQATTAGLSLRVLTGGLSTNITADGGVLTGKKMKYKFTISAIAATGINILIPTSYNISESNTGVYNTKALLAQRMAALINGSPFLNVAVIATQDTPGTDEYFYIETLTAGPSFSYNTAVNFSAINIQRWNSYAITNITGGSILENSNVE